MLRCSGEANVTECVVSTTIRNTHFHWLTYILQGHDKRSPERVLNGVALDPFTSDKTNVEQDERANFN